MKLDRGTIAHVFKYHAPGTDQIDRYARLRAAARVFAEEIINCCPDSEERTLALRDVQRAVMMANASIAINENTRLPTD
jgi:hypothetical protein